MENGKETGNEQFEVGTTDIITIPGWKRVTSKRKVAVRAQQLESPYV